MSNPHTPFVYVGFWVSHRTGTLEIFCVTDLEHLDQKCQRLTLAPLCYELPTHDCPKTIEVSYEDTSKTFAYFVPLSLSTEDFEKWFVDSGYSCVNLYWGYNAHGGIIGPEGYSRLVADAVWICSLRKYLNVSEHE